MTRAHLGAVVLVLTLLVIAAQAPDVEARGHWHSGIYVGVGPFWWAPYPYGWYPDPYYYGSPPVYIVEPPPVYIEMPPAPPPPQYWYYCAPAQAYYPYVQTCTEAWMRVPATRE
jgi:hypothetical protein